MTKIQLVCNILQKEKQKDVILSKSEKLQKTRFRILQNYYTIDELKKYAQKIDLQFEN
jgi:hypothetical protein